MFGTDEIVDEAPLLFVGKTLKTANPTQNLKDIIESFKVFKEISLIEDKEGVEVSNCRTERTSIDGWWVLTFLFLSFVQPSGRNCGQSDSANRSRISTRLHTTRTKV